MQRVGASTLAVSLPNEWVKSVGLKRGDTIFFEQEKDRTLRIITVKQTSEEQAKTIEINADICKDPKKLSRILMGVYALGYDIVNVVSDQRLNIEQMDKIRDVTRELMGLGIMEESPNHVLVQCSIDLTKFPIHTLLRRLYIIASTMHREVINSLSERDVKLAEEAMRRKKEAEMMFWVIVRLLNSCQKDKKASMKLKIENPMQILWYHLAAQYLRLIADWAEKIAEKAVALRKASDVMGEVIGEQLLKDMIEINERAYSVCHMAVNSFFSTDADLANQTIEKYDDIQKAEEQLQEDICSHAYLLGKSFSVSKYFKGRNPMEPCVVAQISFLIMGARRIAELGSEIAEIAIHKLLCGQTKICKENPIEI